MTRVKERELMKNVLGCILMISLISGAGLLIGLFCVAAWRHGKVLFSAVCFVFLVSAIFVIGSIVYACISECRVIVRQTKNESPTDK